VLDPSTPGDVPVLDCEVDMATPVPAVVGAVVVVVVVVARQDTTLLSSVMQAWPARQHSGLVVPQDPLHTGGRVDFAIGVTVALQYAIP
jgi:hypothetical protein